MDLLAFSGSLLENPCFTIMHAPPPIVPHSQTSIDNRPTSNKGVSNNKCSQDTHIVWTLNIYLYIFSLHYYAPLDFYPQQSRMFDSDWLMGILMFFK